MILDLIPYALPFLFGALFYLAARPMHRKAAAATVTKSKPGGYRDRPSDVDDMLSGAGGVGVNSRSAKMSPREVLVSWEKRMRVLGYDATAAVALTGGLVGVAVAPAGSVGRLGWMKHPKDEQWRICVEPPFSLSLCWPTVGDSELYLMDALAGLPRLHDACGLAVLDRDLKVDAALEHVRSLEAPPALRPCAAKESKS